MLAGVALLGKEALFHFLAPTERVAASVLVVEGWVSEDALRQVVEELEQHSYDQVIVSSIAHDSVFRVYSSGGLIFRVAENQGSAASFQHLGIHAYGTSAGGIQAHAQVFVDTTLVGEITVADKPVWYTLTLPDTLKVDSVMIKYDNNRYEGGSGEDRDLYVYSIQLDTLWFPARHPLVYYDRLKIDGRDILYTDYASIAEEAAEYLVAQGVASAQVHTLTAPLVAYERTYAAALEVQQYLADSITAINVFSESAHARRSRLVYEKTLGSAVEVGIIAAHSRHEQPESWWKYAGSRNYVLIQLAKYLYTRVLFYPSLTGPIALETNKNQAYCFSFVEGVVY